MTASRNIRQRRGSCLNPPTCHPSRKHYAKGFCDYCYKADLRRRNPEHAARWRKHRNAYRKSWREKNKERDKQHYSCQNFLRKLRDYGITEQEYRALEKKQDFKCAICGKPRKRNSRLSVDHDHKTGKIRALLCSLCNLDVATVERRVNDLHLITKYLLDHSV